jgi:SOS response regulatory protein OraA/RecX
MRASPRKHSTHEELYAAALRALMRRAHSVFEMRTYLERRATDASLAPPVVARLKQEKLIDDGRYALEFARWRARTRRQGRHRIVRELRTRGVPDTHIEAALAQVFTETDEATLVRKAIERRLRALRARRGQGDETAQDQKKRGRDGAGALDQKQRASLYRTLLRAGFDATLIQREMRAALRGDDAGDFSDSITQDDA